MDLYTAQRIGKATGIICAIKHRNDLPEGVGEALTECLSELEGLYWSLQADDHAVNMAANAANLFGT